MEATLVSAMTSGSGASQKLYRLTVPYDVRDWDGSVTCTVEHVVVSAVMAMFVGAETYVFPADENGEVLDWSELPGSYRGGLDHDEALAGFLAEATAASR